MNRSIRAALTLTVALTILSGFSAASVPIGDSSAATVSASTHPSDLGDGVANFLTTNNVDVTQVAVSPDGEFVAGITSGYQVLVFTNSTAGSPTPTATFTVPGNIDANTMAISNTQSDGGDHILVIGYGHVVVAYNLTVSGSNVDLNTAEKPVWAIWNFTTMFNLPGVATYPIVHDVVISPNGQWLAVTADYALSGIPFSILTYTDNFVTAFGQKYAGTDLNLAIDQDGDWIVDGMSINGAGSIMVFHENAWLGNYSDFQGNTLRYVAISGNGNLCYGVTLGGVYIVETGDQAENYTVPQSLVDVGENSQVSASYTGSQILVSGVAAGGSGAAFYLNYTGGTTAPWTLSWSATNFGGPIDNATLAESNANYFTVSTGSTVYWYYLYAGMPYSATVYYRAVTTDGTIHETALSEDRQTMAIGSAYVNGEQTTSFGEFSVVSDGGIPAPNPPTVTIQVLTPSPGQATAQFGVDWGETGPAPISSYLVNVNASSVSPGANRISGTDLDRTSNDSDLVSGLSFSATYCVTVIAFAYGGANSATSSPVCATTPAQPQSVDPVQPFEVASGGVLGVGVVGLVALTFLTARRKKDRLEPTPMGQGAPPPGGLPPYGGH